MKTSADESCKQTPTWRTVAVAAYEGAELLDITGPIEVFSMLNRCLDHQAGYRIVLLAAAPGPFSSSPGVRLVADAAWEDHPDGIDTIVVPGSPDDALDQALKNDRLIGWLRGADRKARRVVSVCTGAFLLAEAGLLDGRQVTTHWMDLDRLAASYPRLTVERDAIYVRQGNIATSAGVTAGLDLALALVEEDFGRQTALDVARRLVVYLKRPGGQAQFSTQLRAQMVDGGPLAPLLSRLKENPTERYTVEGLADLCAMSPRNFARVFRKETGTTPARYLDQLRLEKAVGMLEEGALPVAQVAKECGFTCPEQLRRAFIRQAGISPVGYRKRFSRGEET